MGKIKLRIRPDKDGDIWVYEQGNPRNVGLVYRYADGSVGYTISLREWISKNNLQSPFAAPLMGLCR